MLRRLQFISFIICLFFFYSLGHANPSISQDKEDRLSIVNKAIAASIRGPNKVSIIDQATLEIPKDYSYIPTKEAADFMQVIGNRTDKNFVGLIISSNDDLRWYITVDFIKSGYVRDSEAKNWNADELLKTIKDGTEEANQERTQNGFSSVQVIGWVEKPTYKTTKHQLIWSMLAKENDSSEATVNYNTYALGRDGYFEFNLVTGESEILQYKTHAKKMLDALRFNHGKSYEDFIEGKDNVAKYGIATLVTGIVAKKLGLIALAVAFFIKTWKLLILLPFFFGSKIKNLFRRNKKEVAA